jgi:hypothetical protein
MGGVVTQIAQGAPRVENFDGTDVSAAWTKVQSAGATITVKDGWATFEAPAGAESHIQQAAPGNNITISAHLARWAGVYLVWDQKNWVGVGKISPTPFGRFYSIAVTDGKPVEIDHRGIDFNGRHDVRIQLGSDHVSFQYQLDGKWTDLRTIERPSNFKGAPKLVAAGIAYTDQDKPFGKTKPAVAEDAAKLSGAIDDVRIEPTPEDALTLTAAQLQAVRHPAPEPVNALLQQSEDDPTYEKIVGYYPPFRSPREIVGVADHPLDIGVDWLGRIDVSPWTPPLAWFEIGDKPQPLGEEGQPFKRRLLDGYLPLITLGRTIDDIDYSLSIFGCSQDFSPTHDLIAYARLTAKAHSPGAKLPEQIALVWDNGQQRHTWKRQGTSADQAQWCIRFTFPKPESAQTIPADEFKQKWDQTAQYWKAKLAPATRFDLPDTRVMEAYRAWIAYSMLDTDTINGHVEPHDGSGFYEEMFGYSVALHNIAMDQFGLHQDAANALATQIHFQQPDGLYTQACGLCDPGSFLAALAIHYQITNDRDWLKKVTPAIVKQCDWLIKQRAQSPREGMLKGLIKFRPYNDYPAPTYNYLGNAWCARGMILCGEVLREIGDPHADQYAAEGEQYRKDVVASMEQSAFDAPDDGQKLLPMEPDTHRLLKMSKNEGGDYWGLVASPVLATDIMPPTAQPARWIVDMLEKREGLIAGVCQFDRGIDHAYTYGYLLNELKQNETRKTLLGFWSFLAFGMTRDTYSPVEVTMIQTGENQYTLPHLYSCTQQLRLLRAMLLREEGDSLILGQGIPRDWLAKGKHVAINKAPTTFGQVSYRIDPQADGSMKIHIEPPTRVALKEIRLYLRQPEKRDIASVQSAGAASGRGKISHDKQTVTLSGATQPLDLIVKFR